MVPRKRNEAAAAAPAISAEKMSYGLIVGVAVTWLLSVIVSTSSLFSVSYIRYQTDAIRRSLMPASCQPTEYNDYQLVHIDCPLRTTANFKLPKQFEGKLLHDDHRDLMRSAVFFEMTMEMFQRGAWYDHILAPGGGANGNNLLRGISGNGGGGAATYFPSLDGIGRQFATNVYAGNFLLAPAILPRLFQTRKLLKIRNEDLHRSSLREVIFGQGGEGGGAAAPPLKITSSNTHAYNDGIYTSEDPRNPKEGDVRIRFFINSATHISAIGIQAPPQLSSYNGSPFKKWVDDNLPQILGHGIVRSILPFDAKNLNYTSDDNSAMVIMREGDFDADQLLALYERENDAFASIHWYALGLFGFTTSALVWSVTKRCGGSAATTSVAELPIVLISGIFLTFGSTLMIASIPNIILSTTWRLGLLQIVASLLAITLAYWSFVRAPDIYNTYSCLGCGSDAGQAIRYRSALLREMVRDDGGAAAADERGGGGRAGYAKNFQQEPLIPKNIQTESSASKTYAAV